mgnify:CR=1 FL=1
MSKALERVIAAQQAEIDRLKAMQESADRYAIVRAGQIDRMASAAFGFMNDTKSTEWRRELMDAVCSLGYCRHCECAPCECQYEEGK